MHAKSTFALTIRGSVCALAMGLWASCAFAGIGSWTSSGPDGASVLALAADPSNPATVYAATIRTLYKSVDSGRHWAPTGLLIRPGGEGFYNRILTTSEPSVVYAVRIGSPFERLSRTENGGDEWVERRTPAGTLVSMTVDPNDPMTLYAVAGGIYRSVNGADAWERLANVPGTGAGIQAVAVDPGDARVLYVAVINGSLSGVYRSSNRGESWSRTGLREPATGLLFDPSDRSRLFALAQNGLHATTNAGQSWTRLAPGSVPVPTDLAIDPADSTRLYVVSGGIVFRSSNGGETFVRVPEETSPAFVDTIAVSGSSAVLAGSSRGISRSEDSGASWASSSRGIREVSVPSVAIVPTEPTVLFAASRQGIYESRDGGGSWNELAALERGRGPRRPEADVIAVDPSNRLMLYAGGWGGVQKSTDGGRTWKRKSPATATDYIADLVIDPNNPRRVFAAYDSVFRTDNGAESWERVMSPENVASFYYPPEVSAIAIAPSDSSAVYAGGVANDYFGGFVSRSEDGGTDWSLPTILASPVRALAVDPCDPRIVYAGTYGGVYRSADGGITWSEPGLAGVSISSLTLDPRHSSSVFAGTSSGLFWTNDSGTSWTRFDPALAEPILSIAVDPSGRFLHAGTGQGVFDLERTFEPCVAGPDRLCLLGARFEVSLTAHVRRTGSPVGGRAVPDGDRFGYFSFPALTGDSSFPEVFIKMADASGRAPFGGNTWIFHSSLTDLDYTVSVRDTQTGRLKTYRGEGFRTASGLTCGLADTKAFAGACVAETLSASHPDGGFAAISGSELALLGGRFRATLRATDPRTGRTAEGAALAKADGFGYFSLPGFTGDPSFPEVFVKMTDATALPGGYFWVFHTGLTDLDYTLTVTDQVTGAVRTYRRGTPEGPELCGEADTVAFQGR